MQGGHPGASDEVARSLPDIARDFHRVVWSALKLGGSRLRMAGNASEPLFLSHLVHTIDLIIGPVSQKLDRIGANGFMVVRLGVCCWRDAGSCTLQRVAQKLF